MNYSDTTYRSNASKFVKNQLRALPFRKNREIRRYNFFTHHEPVRIETKYTKNGIVTTTWESRLAAYNRERYAAQMTENEARFWNPDDTAVWNEYFAIRTLYPTLHELNSEISFEKFKEWRGSISPEELCAAAVIPREKGLIDPEDSKQFLTQTEL